MVITKSISRFARNTLDCLKYIWQLKDRNIPVFFEKENINTMDSKGEVLLTIMVTLAQQENQSLSQNVKLGLQYRYQQGLVQVNHNRFLGYTKDEEGQLIIEPEEAEVVKRIYREYLEGASLAQIGKSLEADGILTAAGKAKWRSETLKKILQNEKYIGDALLQKTYTVDFLSKKRVKNNGIVPQYYVENSHEPIIPRDLYMQVQEKIWCGGQTFTVGQRGRNESIAASMLCQALFPAPNAGIFTAGLLGITEGNILQSGSAVPVWSMDRRNVMHRPFRNWIYIREVLESESREQIAEIDRKLKELQQELLRLANGKKQYGDVVNRIYKLREQRQDVMA